MKKLCAFLLAGLLMLSFGCQGVDMNKAVGAGSDIYSAATVSDAELKEMCVQMRAQGDKENKVAAANNKYVKRLDKIVAKFKNVDGQSLNYKVYLTNDVNANASADGSVRVYSGLMDLMTDDELRFVIGHEIGHVVEGHTLKAMRVAYVSSGAIKAAGAAGGKAAALSESQLGELLDAAVNAQFSQSQESSSDIYGYNLMKKNGYNTKAAGSALRKLDKLSGGKGGGMLASHPNSGDRAKVMDEMDAKK